jgi:hypothetical protein
LGAGPRGVLDIKEHPFFAVLLSCNWFIISIRGQDIDWEHLRRLKPPVVPEVASKIDTSNFPDVPVCGFVSAE